MLPSLPFRRAPRCWRNEPDVNATQLVDVFSSQVRRRSQVIAESSNRTGRTILVFARPRHISCAGRRRNVAQVRREALINKDFSPSRFSWVRCDDFLTLALTSSEGRAYNPTTERGGAGAHSPGKLPRLSSSSPRRVNKQPIVVGCHSASDRLRVLFKWRPKEFSPSHGRVKPSGFGLFDK